MFPINASRRNILKAMSALGVAGVGISLTSCSPKDAAKPAETINFFNWDDYIGETTLADFKTASGIDVKMSLFANNDELFAKMRSGNSGFDVIMPSNDFVTRLADAKLIMALDHAKIPNMKNIDPAFLDPSYDPKRTYSMPYTWLTLGIGYRESKMPKGFVPNSWKYVFDSNMFKKRISWLSEAGDLIRLCAKYHGYSVNNLTPEALAKVEATLTKQIKGGNILNFHSDDGQDMLERGDVDVVIEYSGDLAQRNAENSDMKYVIPIEGSQFNADNMAIPTDSKKIDAAHAFINYLLDAEAGAKIADYIQYGTPNAAARALTSDAYKNNPITFPAPEILAKCEYAAFPGAEMAQKFEEIISRVRAAGGM